MSADRKLMTSRNRCASCSAHAYRAVEIDDVAAIDYISGDGGRRRRGASAAASGDVSDSAYVRPSVRPSVSER